MGLAASQARLLSLTSRIHDVEFEAQQIQSAKLQLALLEDKAYQEYNNALDAQSLTFQDMKGNRVAATFDNLCGLGSINNNIGTNKHYIFRDRDDRLLVPSEVYQGFKDYGGSDPYEFAMYMMMDKNQFEAPDLSNPESNSTKFQAELMKYFEETSGTDLLKTQREQMKNILKELYSSATDKGVTTNEDEWVNERIKEIMTTDFNEGAALSHFAEGITGKLSDVEDTNRRDKLQTLINLGKECKYKMYKNGAEDIYKNTIGDSNAKLDTDTFNYYVRWGKLIMQEGGIDGNELSGCTNANYDTRIETDAEMLNDMLQAGYITIEIVTDRADGTIDEDYTSASSDSNLSFVNSSSLDSAVLKKAEADYNKKLKDIERIDKKHDMNLNRLETERTALTTEYDSVKKVISENIERTFGIFS